jgi:hypothetical protein
VQRGSRDCPDVGQLVSLGGGVRYWVESPDGGAEGFGFRMTTTLLFPR